MSEFGMKSSILTHEVRFPSWTKSDFAWSPRKPSCCHNNSVALNIATWRPGANSRLMQQTFRGLGLVELGVSISITIFIVTVILVLFVHSSDCSIILGMMILKFQDLQGEVETTNQDACFPYVICPHNPTSFSLWRSHQSLFCRIIILCLWKYHIYHLWFDDCCPMLSSITVFFFDLILALRVASLAKSCGVLGTCDFCNSKSPVSQFSTHGYF